MLCLTLELRPTNDDAYVLQLCEDSNRFEVIDVYRNHLIGSQMVNMRGLKFNPREIEAKLDEDCEKI